MPINGITLFLFGGVAEIGDEPPSAATEFLMAIAGPAVTVVLGILFWLLALAGYHAGWPHPLVIVLGYLALINALVLAFNFVPAFPLDGGRVLRSILWGISGNLRKSTYWASLAGRGFAWFLIAYGIVQFFSGNWLGGIWMGLIGMFLNNAAQSSYGQVLLRQALQGEPVRRFMNSNPIVVPPSIDLQHWLDDYVYRYHHRAFPVASNGHLEGMITTEALNRVPRTDWHAHTVGEVASSDLQAVSIAPDADALDAFGKMHAHQHQPAVGERRGPVGWHRHAQGSAPLPASQGGTGHGNRAARSEKPSMMDSLDDSPTGETAGGILGRKEQTVEVAVFLFLIVPSMVLSLFAVQQGSLSFPLVATAMIFRDLALVSLVCLFLWRNGEPFARIGWTCRRAGREAILGMILFVPFFFGAAELDRALLHAGLSAPTPPLPSFLRERGPIEAILALLLVSVVAVAEETIFRGYLLLRFQAVLRSKTAAVLLSSVIFATGHGYEGSAGLATVGIIGRRFRRDLPVAWKSDRSHRHALPSRLPQRCFAAIAGGEMNRSRACLVENEPPEKEDRKCKPMEKDKQWHRLPGSRTPIARRFNASSSRRRRRRRFTTRSAMYTICSPNTARDRCAGRGWRCLTRGLEKKCWKSAAGLGTASCRWPNLLVGPARCTASISRSECSM